MFVYGFVADGFGFAEKNFQGRKRDQRPQGKNEIDPYKIAMLLTDIIKIPFILNQLIFKEKIYFSKRYFMRMSDY